LISEDDITPNRARPRALGDESDSAQAGRSKSDWLESEFEQFFLENYARIVALISRVVADRARAEELADDAFWKLYSRSMSPRRNHNLRAWLYRTATRLGLDALRASARRNKYESAAASQPGAHEDAETPLAEIIRSEKQEQVRRVLSRLKPAQAQILLLRSGGLSYKEIAEAMDLKPSSVGALLVRAEEAFSQIFATMFPDTEF